VVEVQALLTIFHGLNDSFVTVVNWEFPFVVFVIVMLLPTVVAVNLL